MLAAAVCVAAQAQQPPTQAPRVASREEFRACRVDQRALEADQTALAARVERYQAALAAHQNDSEARMAAAGTKPARSARDVDAYNAVVAKLNARAQLLNDESKALTGEQDAFNDRVAKVNVRCGHLVVDALVAKEIEKELEAPRAP